MSFYLPDVTVREAAAQLASWLPPSVDALSVTVTAEMDVTAASRSLDVPEGTLKTLPVRIVLWRAAARLSASSREGDEPLERSITSTLQLGRLRYSVGSAASVRGSGMLVTK